MWVTLCGVMYLVPLLLAVFVACACDGSGALPETPSDTEKRPDVLHEFALLFRSSLALDPDVLRRRNAAAREWALDLRRRELLTTASPLEPTGNLVSGANVEPVTEENQVLSVLIIRAADIQAATRLVQSHPGLQFDTQIEVRPVKAVAQ